MKRLQSLFAITLSASVFVHAAEKEPAAAPAEQVKPAQEASPKKAGGDYDARLQEVKTALDGVRDKGEEAFMAVLEKYAWALQKDFPEKEEPYQMLLGVARTAEPAKVREIVKILSSDKAPEQAREQAKGLLAKFDRVGKPLELKFKAVDDREVDLAKMKGKVVLVDFWATWCGPCVAEIPHIKEAYDKFHEKGFEIVGISFDEDKDKLTSFVKEKAMPWPQYFESKAGDNVFGQQFAITGIPTMWLVNKKGELVDVDGRQKLAEKVEKLLAE